MNILNRKIQEKREEEDLSRLSICPKCKKKMDDYVFSYGRGKRGGGYQCRDCNYEIRF